MKGEPWHKRYHRRTLQKYRALEPALRGIAYTLLDLIYDNGGPLHRTDQMIAGDLVISARLWRSAKEKLIQAGLFYVAADGSLSNGTCEDVLAEWQQHARNGSIGGQVRAENARKSANQPRTKSENAKEPNENNGNDQAPLQAGFNHRDVEIEKKDSEAKASDASASEPPTVKAQIWAVGRPMFEKAGTDKKAAGAVIGALIKRKGEVEALTIITALRADTPMDPEQYLWAIIHGKQALATDVGAAPQLELVLIDGKPVMQPIGRRAA